MVLKDLKGWLTLLSIPGVVVCYGRGEDFGNGGGVGKVAITRGDFLEQETIKDRREAPYQTLNWASFKFKQRAKFSKAVIRVSGGEEIG